MHTGTEDFTVLKARGTFPTPRTKGGYAVNGEGWVVFACRRSSYSSKLMCTSMLPSSINLGAAIINYETIEWMIGCDDNSCKVMWGGKRREEWSTATNNTTSGSVLYVVEQDEFLRFVCFVVICFFVVISLVTDFFSLIHTIPLSLVLPSLKPQK